MGKKKKSKKGESGGKSDAPSRMPKKEYEDELLRLQVELCKMQAWVKKTGTRIVVIFEGRDAAGKGGVIKRIKERVSPRVYRVVALPAPPIARRRRCTTSATSRTCRQPARSCCSTAVGTTAPASSG